MAMMYETSDIRNGLKVEIEGEPWMVTWFQFVKPGKGTAFTRTKFKNMLTGNVVERNLRTGEQLKPADVEEHPMEYLYEDGDFYHFMNKANYEQVGIPASQLEEQKGYLTPNLEVTVLFFKGKAVSVDLPYFIESEVTYCEPGVRGNTATGTTKPATLACGATVQVPLFIDTGEKIKVDTRTGHYVSRVK